MRCLTRRAAAARLCSAAAVGAVAGLAGAALPRPVRAAAAPATVSWTTWNTGGLLTEIRAWVAAFEKANPHIAIDISDTPNNYDAHLFTLAAAGKLPDVVHADIVDAPELLSRGLLMDVAADYRSANFDYAAYLPFSPVFRNGGHIWGGLEDYGKIFMIFYNADMFRAAGLTDPYILWKRGDWTWQAFRNSAAQLTKASSSGGKPQWGFYPQEYYETDWLQFLYAGGGRDWVTVDRQYRPHFNLTAAKVVSAITFYTDLVDIQRSLPAAVLNNIGNDDPFSAGYAAMISNGNWAMADYPSQIAGAFSWGVVPLPTPSGAPTGSWHEIGTHALVTRHADNVEASVAWARFFFGGLVQDTMATYHTLLPMLRSAFATTGFTKSPAQHVEVLGFIAQHSAPYQVFLGYNTVINELQTYMNDAFALKMTPQQALSQAQARIGALEGAAIREGLI